MRPASLPYGAAMRYIADGESDWSGEADDRGDAIQAAAKP